MITVYHARFNEGDRDIAFLLSLRPNAQLIAALVDRGVLWYEPVAVVQTESVNTAFRETNSIDSPWWENARVTKLFDGEGCRSTSVGDIMDVAHGEHAGIHLCNGISIEPIDDFDVSLHFKVHQAMDNAKDNGHDYAGPEYLPRFSDEEIAEDICECDSDCEEEDVKEVAKHVKSWRARHMYVPGSLSLDQLEALGDNE